MYLPKTVCVHLDAPICDTVWSMSKNIPTIKMAGSPKYEFRPTGPFAPNLEELVISIEVQYGDWRMTSSWSLRNGRQEAEEVKFTRDDSPVTGTSLRGLPLGEMFAESRRLIAFGVEMALGAEDKMIDDDLGYISDLESGSIALEEGAPVTSEEMVAYLRFKTNFLRGQRSLVEPFGDTGPRRGHPLTIDDLRPVAEIYKTAYKDHKSVQAAVAKAFQIAPSTATKRIMAARKAGLLEGIGPR